MRVLILGGFGYLGGRLASFLYQHGHDVVLGSRVKRPTPAKIPEVDVFRTDWDNPKTLEKAFKHVDIVVYASGVNAKDCVDNPGKALSVNTGAVKAVLAAGLTCGVKKIIYLSTAHVYASPLNGIITENSIVRNEHPYAQAHAGGEEVLRRFKNDQLSFVILRLSNAVGPPSSICANCWGLFVNDICRQIIKEKKITIRNNAGVQRDFIGVSEVCRVIDFLITKDLSSFPDPVFNLGSGTSQSLLEIAKLVQERALTSLNCYPVIEEMSPFHPCDKFYFKTDRLQKAGFHKKANIKDELDDLLSLCYENFSNFSTQGP